MYGGIPIPASLEFGIAHHVPLQENGPYWVDSQLQLHENPFSWNVQATMIYVDQPAGAGFSFADAEYIHDEAAVAQEMSSFLQQFFQKYPKYSKQQFFIAGESYGGRYVPALAQQILKDKMNINLKGISIGNGLVSPALQYSLQPTYASWESLINKTTYSALKQTATQCLSLSGQQKWHEANKLCGSIVVDILNAAGDVDVRSPMLPTRYPDSADVVLQPTNILNNCTLAQCFDYGNITRYLNVRWELILRRRRH